MNIPTWEEFSKLFEKLTPEQDLAAAQALMQSHPKAAEAVDPDEGYAEVFYHAFVILFEDLGIDLLLERCAEVLGQELSVQKGQHATTITYKGQTHHFDYTVPDDAQEHFEKELARFQQILSGDYQLKLFPVMTSSLSFILIPNEIWNRAITHYGEKTITSYFLNYDDPFDAQLIDKGLDNSESPSSDPKHSDIQSSFSEPQNNHPRETPKKSNAKKIIIGIFTAIALIQLAFIVMKHREDKTQTTQTKQECINSIDKMLQKLSPAQQNATRKTMIKQAKCDELPD